MREAVEGVVVVVMGGGADLVLMGVGGVGDGGVIRENERRSDQMRISRSCGGRGQGR